MTTSNTTVHVGPDEIVGASVQQIRETFALKIGSPYYPSVTLFMNKQQLASICRDMEVIYMVEVLGAEEKDVMP
jgi:hypothetical protein